MFSLYCKFSVRLHEIFDPRALMDRVELETFRLFCPAFADEFIWSGALEDL